MTYDMESLEMVSYMRKISFFFFVVMGFAHFLFGMLWTSGIFQENALLITRLLFAPFLLASISYAYTVVKEHSLQNGHGGKVLDYLFLGLGIIALIGSLFIEFYFPDKGNLL